jgi:phosphatidate phosphatase APP1
MNKILSLCVLLFLSISAMANSRPYIISGFDDVLRQAENTGLFKAALKILEKDKTFAGMPELYSEISKEETNPKFVLVSGISSWFTGRIEDFLKSSGYPKNELYLRSWLTQWFVEDFKIDRMKEIMVKISNRQFIIIFDNSDASIGLSKKIYEQFGEKVHIVYLRQVVEKETPQNAKSFYTAFDIAYNEYVSGRMSASEITRVGEAVVKEKKLELLFPSYALCPKTYNPCRIDAGVEILAICALIKNHVESICKDVK